VSNVQDFTFAGQLGPPRDPERVVKPRKDANVNMRIAVCDATMKVWYEDRTDMRTDWDLVEFVHFVRDHWPRDIDGSPRTTPIMFVCHNPHKVFQRLHEAFKSDPEWNARFSVNAAERFHLDGNVRESKVKTTRDIRIGFFGFRSGNRKTKYFHPVTPLDFMDDFAGYGESEWPEYIRLYHWGASVRKWMKKHRLRFTATRGGLSSQLLRDRRFYPESRRKVPKLTNEKARTALPGNFYAMAEDSVGKLYAGVYLIDQENAHHHAAENVILPNANSLFARGRFASSLDKPFAREGRVTYEDMMGEHGLFRVRVWVPKHWGGMVPPWNSRNGLTDLFLFSNELAMAEELGMEIRHISYAWTSRDRDEGLAKYAEWAQGEVAAHPEHRQWLKPTLLSAYGILGVRPRVMEMAYWKSEKGEPYRYLLGPTPIMMNRMRTTKDIQPGIANLIHRGMIEAETRKLSIQLARRMESEGHTVIAIHADAVLVKDEGQQLPLLPPPWRVKDRLTGFQAIDQVSFRSDTVTVLPGRKKRRAKR